MLILRHLYQFMYYAKFSLMTVFCICTKKINLFIILNSQQIRNPTHLTNPTTSDRSDTDI